MFLWYLISISASVCYIALINFFEHNISWTIKYYFLSTHFLYQIRYIFFSPIVVLSKGEVSCFSDRNARHSNKVNCFKNSSHLTSLQNSVILFFLLGKNRDGPHCILPTAEILSGKNARAWVSMVLHLENKIKILKY